MSKYQKTPGQPFCFGKKEKRNDYRTLQFADYLVPSLPPPPVASDNLARVYKALGVSDPTQLYPMDGNDTEGDCTIAGRGHFITTANAFLGQKVIPAAADVLAFYLQLTGGQDTGLDLLTVCNYCHQNGYLGQAPDLAFVEVDPTNLVHMKTAISMFGFLYVGFQVQANAIKEFQQRKPWTPGKLTQDGHCVVLADYTAADYVALTWGNTQLGTYAWAKECLDEAYAIVPAAASTPGYIPGFNTQQLLADLAAVTK
jgi:hypothetical protein